MTAFVHPRVGAAVEMIGHLALAVLAAVILFAAVMLVIHLTRSLSGRHRDEIFEMSDSDLLAISRVAEELCKARRSFTPAMDDRETDGALIDAARAYLQPPASREAARQVDVPPEVWPYDFGRWHPDPEIVDGELRVGTTELVRAAQFLLAEISRRERNTPRRSWEGAFSEVSSQGVRGDLEGEVEVTR